jgi:hypothetical protein
MKKILLSLVLALAVPAITFAYFQPATLTNGINKVAVFSQEQANKYFGMGYFLDGKQGAVTSNTQYNRGFFTNGITEGGSIASLSTSSAALTATANDICNSKTLKVTPLGAAVTLTLPATSTAMFNKCLPRVGDSIDLNYLSVGTSTTIAAGAGGTLGYVSSASVAAGKYGIIRILRTASATYNAYVINIGN